MRQHAVSDLLYNFHIKYAASSFHKQFITLEKYSNKSKKYFAMSERDIYERKINLYLFITSLRRLKRLANFVWYCLYTEKSKRTDGQRYLRNIRIDGAEVK